MNELRDQVLFWCLLLVQTIGAQIFLWGELPAFQRIQAVGMGDAALQSSAGRYLAIAVLAAIVMQLAHWPAARLKLRLRFRRNAVLGKILTWFGELSIFFAAALSSLILFNGLGHGQIDPWLALALAGMTFAVSSYKYQLMSVGAAMIEGDRAD
jgi:hypothetical protein